MSAALEALQKDPQLWEEVQLHQTEPERPGHQEELALQTGEQSGNESGALAKVAG